jgi:hypothetical protein
MAIAELEYRFRPRTAGKADAAIEALIDKAGREKVFAAARALGWTKETPPKWVWQQIAGDIIAGRSHA